MAFKRTIPDISSGQTSSPTAFLMPSSNSANILSVHLTQYVHKLVIFISTILPFHSLVCDRTHSPFLFAERVSVITLQFEWATFRRGENMSKTGNLFLFQFYLTLKNQYEGGCF